MKTSANLLFLVFFLLPITGCQTMTLEKSVASVMTAVDNARMAYYEQVAQGLVSEEKQAEIDAAIETYQAAVGPTIFLVRNDLSQAAPEDFVWAATAVIDLIAPLIE